jgi:beta-lactamase regulating signal transducer with metallopeptidase domain
MVGVIRPLVILPQKVLGTLAERELADVLVHECAHAICRHQVVSVLQRLAGMFFWPHPLVHSLNRELARAREEVCDNYVLRRSAAPNYARTLLELSQLLVGVSAKPTALGLFHCHWRLEDRIADLLDRRRKVMTGVNRWTTAALTVTFLMLGVLIAATNVVQAATIQHRPSTNWSKVFPKRPTCPRPSRPWRHRVEDGHKRASRRLWK